MTNKHRGAQVAEALHSQAAWRRRQDEEYPDPRNARWADAADAAADYAAALPDSDPLLARIAAHSSLEMIDVLTFGEQSGQFVTTSTLAPDAFLNELADLLQYENRAP